MSLQDIARGAHSVISGALATDAAVDVISDGETVTGIRGVRTRSTDADELGELGFNTNLVRVSATLDAPTRGSTIVVNGLKVFVVACRTDPAGAMHVIEYSEQQIKQD